MNAPLSEFAHKRVRQTVEYSKLSDTHGKYACATAYYAGVGEHSHYTKMIAEARGRSVSSVENWANAFKLYSTLRRVVMADARRLWRKLDASKWWLAYGIHKAGYDALHYLLMAESHNLSGRDMMAEYRADLDAGQVPMQINRVKITFRGLADELLKSNTLTPAQAAAADAVLRAFEEAG